jgi:rod shape-determining protein MreC
MESAAAYFVSVSALQNDNAELKRKNVEIAGERLRQEQLIEENQRLRSLLEVKQRHGADGVVAEILYDARDPFRRKVIIDKGLQHGVAAGQVVIDDAGVLGQVTRAYPLQAEVTLLSDKDHAIPVQNSRTGLRAVAFGIGPGQMELRFLAPNSDVQNGDVLVTSGLDGVYLPGMPVAKVVRVDRDAAYSFARILCEPAAGIERHSFVLVLSRHEAPPPPPTEEEAKDRAVKPVKKRRVRE